LILKRKLDLKGGPPIPEKEQKRDAVTTGGKWSGTEGVPDTDPIAKKSTRNELRPETFSRGDVM